MVFVAGSKITPFCGKLGAIAIAAALFAMPVGCNDKALQSNGGVDGGHGESASLTPEQAAKVLAKVGDKTITLGDFVATLEHMDQFDRLRYQSPERRAEMLHEMIDIELLAQEAAAKGYDQDPVAQEQMRAILRDAVLSDARKSVPLPNDIPEAEVRAYFDAHHADYHDPERRRISLIVLKDEATAKTVLALAKKSPNAADWGDLVRKNSIDSQAKANVPVDLAGDFGMVNPPGDSRSSDNLRAPKDVGAAAFGIANVNDVLDQPVASSDGKFYLIRLTQKSEPHDRAYAEAERSIRVKISEDKIRNKEDDLIAQLRTQFPVQIDDGALAQVRVNLADAGPP
ncbi:MAG: peptidyl-prolyl cis-trans isomerase [Polyangiaceae bacterium]